MSGFFLSFFFNIYFNVFFFLVKCILQGTFHSSHMEDLLIQTKSVCVCKKCICMSIIFNEMLMAFEVQTLNVVKFFFTYKHGIRNVHGNEKLIYKCSKNIKNIKIFKCYYCYKFLILI